MTAAALLREWRARLESAAAEVHADVGGLTNAQRAWNPPEGAWSVGQVLDHLARTNEEYLPLIDQAIDKGRRGAGRDWKPSFFGGMLARALLSPKKSRAPRAFVPGGQMSDQPLERFLSSVRGMVREIDRAGAVDLRTATHSPASRLIRLNLGDAIHLQVLHAERHLQQIRRVKEHADFPG